MNRIPRRVFTAQYKAEAVKLAGAVGVPMAVRQREMATKSLSLYLWIKQSTEGKLKASGPIVIVCAFRARVGSAFFSSRGARNAQPNPSRMTRSSSSRSLARQGA